MNFVIFALSFIIINAGLSFGICWFWTSDLTGDWKIKAMALMTPPMFCGLCISETVLMGIIMGLLAHKGKVKE